MSTNPEPPLESNKRLIFEEGDISIGIPTNIFKNRSWSILLMGPTGAGKSSFIEALGGVALDLQISSNKLDGCTQTIKVYELKNVKFNVMSHLPIYLVDTPGFADAKISEMGIISMIMQWIKDNDDSFFDRILYLTPINSVRLPGSQRQVLKTFQAITGQEKAKHVTIATTMWDQLWGEKATKRADKTYAELKNVIWKDFIKEGANITRFYNTQRSALSIIDTCLGDNNTGQFSTLEKTVSDNTKFLASPFGTLLYEDLCNRIQSLRVQQENIGSELNGQEDKRLRSVLMKHLEETNTLLSKFEREMEILGYPLTAASPRTSAQEVSPSRPSSSTPIDEAAEESVTEQPETIKKESGRRTAFVRTVNSLFATVVRSRPRH